MQSGSVFKVCKTCGFEWKTRDDFIKDKGTKLIGYQVDFRCLDAGIFLFNHSCDNTLAFEAAQFADLYDGQIFEDRRTGSDECPEYCLYVNNLKICPVKCECAFVREIIQIIRN